jgi:hypothetical protein
MGLDVRRDFPTQDFILGYSQPSLAGTGSALEHSSKADSKAPVVEQGLAARLKPGPDTKPSGRWKLPGTHRQLRNRGQLHI